jgi:zinc and cadmium transporter
MIFLWILGSTLLVSLISLIGVFSLAVKDRLLKDILLLLVGFAAGALIGGAFLHLIPEAIEKIELEAVFGYLMVGFVLFFILERYFYWRHCHSGVCDVHAFTYLNLVGDGLHNFMDGIIIAISFVASIKLGIVTTLAVIFHEIPQELGDFGILVYGGFKKSKALLFNFLCALTAILGALVGYLLANRIENISPILMSITAGGFMYIASSDLIPELHKVAEMRRANLALLFFVIGVVFMWLAKLIPLH